MSAADKADVTVASVLAAHHWWYRPSKGHLGQCVCTAWTDDMHAHTAQALADAGLVSVLREDLLRARKERDAAQDRCQELRQYVDELAQELGTERAVTQALRATLGPALRDADADHAEQIRMAVADTRERIAQAIEALPTSVTSPDPFTGTDHTYPRFAYDLRSEAARIARGDTT